MSGVPLSLLNRDRCLFWKVLDWVSDRGSPRRGCGALARLMVMGERRRPWLWSGGLDRPGEAWTALDRPRGGLGSDRAHLQPAPSTWRPHEAVLRGSWCTHGNGWGHGGGSLAGSAQESAPRLKPREMHLGTWYHTDVTP